MPWYIQKGHKIYFPLNIEARHVFCLFKGTIAAIIESAFLENS
jgi:hypothetical protein